MACNNSIHQVIVEVFTQMEFLDGSTEEFPQRLVGLVLNHLLSELEELHDLAHLLVLDDPSTLNDFLDDLQELNLVACGHDLLDIILLLESLLYFLKCIQLLVVIKLPFACLNCEGFTYIVDVKLLLLLLGAGLRLDGLLPINLGALTITADLFTSLGINILFDILWSLTYNRAHAVHEFLVRLSRRLVDVLFQLF